MAWNAGPGGGSGVISATSSVLLPGLLMADLDDETVVRTRGRLLLTLLTAGGAGNGYDWAFGMCVVSENAEGVGVTAIPSPTVDIGWDGWFVYEQGSLSARDGTPAVDESGPNVVQMIEIDSKAMRKTRKTDRIVALFGFTEVGVATMEAIAVTRVLGKLA